MRHELLLAMDEAEPEKVLCRLADLGVLQLLQPELQCDTWLREKARDLRAQFAMVQDPRSHVPPHMTISPSALARLHLALVTYRLSAGALEEFIERYRLLKEDRDLTLEVARLRERLPRLAENNLAGERHRRPVG